MATVQDTTAQEETTRMLSDVMARLDNLSKPMATPLMPDAAKVILPFPGSNAGTVTLAPAGITHDYPSLDLGGGGSATKTQTADTQSAKTNTNINASTSGDTKQAAQLSSADSSSGNIDVMGAITKSIQDSLAPKKTSDMSMKDELAQFKNDLSSLSQGVQGLFDKTTADTANTQQAVAQSSKKSGSSGIGDIVDIGLSLIGWIICTELVRQNRMPSKYWAVGSKVFAGYNDFVKEGYYVWAVPSVRHLRAHPFSLYSRFLSLIFNWRAENIAAHCGIKGARKLKRGALVTAILWPICFILGVCLRVVGYKIDWRGVYAK